MLFLRCLLFIFFVLIGQGLSAQTRAGYFDYSLIEKSMPLSERLEDFQLAIEKHLNDSIHILESNIQEYYLNIYTDRFTDSIERKEVQTRIIQLNADLSNYKIYARERYYSALEAMRGELKNKAFEIIKAFCALNKLDVLAEKSSIAQCNECKDYTQEIIEYYNSLGTTKSCSGE